MDDPLTKRRKFLQGAGVSGTALLAGCTGILDSDDDDDTTPDDDALLDANDDAADDAANGDADDGDVDDGDDQDDSIQHGDGDTREVGIVAEPDQEALAELQQEAQAGEIEQEEAIERQQEIIEEAIENLTEVLQTETDIQVDEEFPDLGAVRATGDPSEIVDSLTSARVSALVETGELEVEQQPTG